MWLLRKEIAFPNNYFLFIFLACLLSLIVFFCSVFVNQALLFASPFVILGFYLIFRNTKYGLFFSLVFLSLLAFIYFVKAAHVYTLHIGLFFLALFFLYEKSFSFTIEKLGLKKDILKNILVGFGGFILLVLVAIGLNLILMVFDLSDSNKVYEKMKDLPLYVLPFAFIVAPLSEELFFRGYLVKKYGILVSALIFSLVHIAYGSIAEILFAFAFGIIAGYLYKKRGSLLVPIVMHFLFNLMFVIVFLARIYLESRGLI